MRQRENSAEPRYDTKYQRWILQKQIDGTRKTFTSSKQGKAGYNEVKRKYNRALATGLDATNPQLRNIVPEYLADIQARKGSDSNSYWSAKSVMDTRLDSIASKRVSVITEQDLQNILNTAERLDGRDGQLSRKTVMNIRSELVLLFKYLRKAGYIDWSPDDLEIPKRFEYKNDKQILQPDEVRYMLNDDTPDFNLYAWQLMLLYGFRPSEVYGLQWSDVEGSKLALNRAINYKGQVTTGKNKNALRVEYLTSQAKAVLSRARKLQVERNQMSKWILVNKHGQHLRAKTNNEALQRYCEENGLTVVTTYRLRHTFVSLMKNVLTEAQLKMTVGHSDSMDTLGVYGHSLESDHIDTGQVLQSYFDDLLA